VSERARAWAATHELPPDEATLLTTLGHYARTTAGLKVVCSLSHPTLVQLSGLPKGKIAPTLASLEARGLISREPAPGGRAPTTYTLHLPAGVAS
jgi:hypothetical protein